MHYIVSLAKYRLLALAVVLGIAVASVAGVTFSSNSAGGKSIVTAIRYSDVVRFTIQNDKVVILRAEVFDLGGKRLFDSGPTMGNALGWARDGSSVEALCNGVWVWIRVTCPVQ